MGTGPLVTWLSVTQYGLPGPQSDIHSSDQSYELCMIILIIICMALGTEAPVTCLLVTQHGLPEPVEG